MKTPGIITLTTDFGLGSAYVAEMKGAILSMNPSVCIVDATHGIEPQNVLQGALSVRQFAKTFPPCTVHVVVVDPGVGSQRKIILVEHDEQFFIGPDNGVLTFQIENASRIVVADQPKYWRSEVSRTFHGRDVMAPLAAHLVSGVSVDQIGSRFRNEPVVVSIPRTEWNANAPDGAATLGGEVVYVDSFGNLLTNVSSEDLAEFDVFQVALEGREIPFRSTYSNAAGGELLSLIGSSDWLEVAVNGGNASQELGASVGQRVVVNGRRKPVTHATSDTR